MDNCQLTIFGGFAPNSKTAEELSRSMGSRTVLTGSVSLSKDEQSKSLQMTERSLMTADEIKTMKRGEFIVERNGMYAMKAKFKLFKEWGIELFNNYTVFEKQAVEIHYADAKRVLKRIESTHSSLSIQTQNFSEQLSIKDLVSPKGIKTKGGNSE